MNINAGKKGRRIRKKALKWIGIMVLIVIIFVIVDDIFFTKESEPSIVYLESPEWMDHYIDTSAEIIDQGSGPEIWGNEDSYKIIKIAFYDQNESQITDQNLVDELLNMLIYTDDDFIYSRERSEPGYGFFYYNGVLPADKHVSLIAGFKGKEGFSVEKVMIGIDSISFSALIFDSMEEFLAEFEI